MLVQVGFQKEPDLPDVPLLLDLVKDEEDKGVIRVDQPADRDRLWPLARARSAEGPHRGVARRPMRR